METQKRGEKTAPSTGPAALPPNGKCLRHKPRQFSLPSRPGFLLELFLAHASNPFFCVVNFPVANYPKWSPGVDGFFL